MRALIHLIGPCAQFVFLMSVLEPSLLSDLEGRWKVDEMSSRSVAQSLVGVFGSVSWRARLAVLQERLQGAKRAVETRRELQDLDAHVLADIGVSRDEAAREARRAPWDLQPARLRPALDWAFSGGMDGIAPGQAVPSHRAADAGRGWEPAGRWGGRSSKARTMRERWITSRQWLVDALHRRRSRQAITELDGFLMRDIGVSHAEAEHEANKPFWR